MNRREFLAAGVGGALGSSVLGADEWRKPTTTRQDSLRAAFPRLESDVFLNAAGGTPLGTFAEEGLRRYVAFQQLGPGAGRGDYVAEMQANVGGLFGELIGARASEIALVHCTKAGEQIVLDGLDPLGRGRNVVTNDMHFSGSLHNLVGYQRAGADVRIVRGRDWDVALEDMAAAIDDRTALVAVTLLSNVNGRIEPMRELADIAHAHGALVYADIIQAAGIVPLDMRRLGIDFAASNGYKWLYGVHGAGFLYVRDELQGTALPDRLFPGHVQYNYSPWVPAPDPQHDALMYSAPTDASRYQPGHVSYLAYCAVYEGLKVVHEIGVDAALRHSVRLNQHLRARLDPNRFECITPEVDRSPIIAFAVKEPGGLRDKLRAGNVVITVAGNRLRVSPGLYNHVGDIDVLADLLS
jgi:selenocysteine lyase/cysteine desulfurase